MATLLYQGHGSLRLTTENGKVIYIDPFAGSGYDVPADLILVTHQHPDHNCIDLPVKNKDCVIWQNFDAFKDSKYQTLKLDFVTVEGVEAYNQEDYETAVSCFKVVASIFPSYEQTASYLEKSTVRLKLLSGVE